MRSPHSANAADRWLGIDTGQVADWDLTAHNRINPYRHGAPHRLAIAANDERLLRNHPRVKRPRRAAHHAVNGRRREPPMRPEARRRLERAFAEPNRRLRVLLTEPGYADLPAWLDAQAGSWRE